jgi:nucleotide-binding universal stress UspA family protein
MASVAPLRFRNPLLYVDPHAREDLAAFELASRYAKSRGVPLRIVSAVDDPAWSLLGHSKRARRLHDETIESAEEKIASLAERAKRESVKADVDLLRGPPPFEIIRAVTEAHHDIVFKTMMGASEKAKMAFGSVGRRLLRQSPSAVMLVNPNLKKLERVMVALGSSTQDGEADEIAVRSLSAGLEWAEFMGAPLHVVHAWSPYGVQLMATKVSVEELDQYIEWEKEAATNYLRETLSSVSLDLPDDRLHLLEGPARLVIPSALSDEQHDLLVLGSAARSGVPGLLIGNTAESVLDNIECSFLVVKPKDFVSPVTWGRRI